MIREWRYTVIKNKDLEGATREGYLLSEQYNELVSILRGVQEYRDSKNKASLEAVVVESDWPEYEPTWKAIEERVSAQESYL